MKEINQIDENLFLEIFEGVPGSKISIDNFNINIIDFLVEKSGFLNSNSEARRSLDEKSIYINKVKVSKEYMVSQSDLLKNKYIVINKGKKKTFMVEILKI